MDANNYTLKKEEIQYLQEVAHKIKQDIIKILEKNNPIKRHRILKDIGILVSAVIMYFTEGLSFKRLAVRMSIRYSIQMSDTAWKKQFVKVAPLLLSVVREYIAARTQTALSQQIYAIDATDFSSATAKGTVARVHTMLSLDSQGAVSVKVTDNHTSERISHFQLYKYAIYIADRAYGLASQIEYTLQCEANFIYRITPSHIKLYRDSECFDRINVSELLNEGELSVVCYVKSNNNVYKVRLICSPIPEDKKEEAVQRACKNSSRKSKTTRESTKTYATWMFLVTSLFTMPLSKIVEIYRKRWAIEIFFKRSKSFLNLHRFSHFNNANALHIVSLWTASALLMSMCLFIAANNPLINISDFYLCEICMMFFS